MGTSSGVFGTTARRRLPPCVLGARRKEIIHDPQNPGQIGVAVTCRRPVCTGDRGITGDAAGIGQRGVRGADAARLTWDDVNDRGDSEVYELVFSGRGEHQSVFDQPGWESVHKELARVGVTLVLLHGEYTDTCVTTGVPAMGYCIEAAFGSARGVKRCGTSVHRGHSTSPVRRKFSSQAVPR